MADFRRVSRLSRLFLGFLDLDSADFRAFLGILGGLSRVRPAFVPGLSRGCPGLVPRASRACPGFVPGGENRPDEHDELDGMDREESFLIRVEQEWRRGPPVRPGLLAG